MSNTSATTTYSTTRCNGRIWLLTWSRLVRVNLVNIGHQFGNLVNSGQHFGKLSQCLTSVIYRCTVAHQVNLLTELTWSACSNNLILVCPGNQNSHYGECGSSATKMQPIDLNQWISTTDPPHIHTIYLFILCLRCFTTCARKGNYLNLIQKLVLSCANTVSSSHSSVCILTINMWWLVMNSIILVTLCQFWWCAHKYLYLDLDRANNHNWYLLLMSSITFGCHAVQMQHEASYLLYLFWH